MKKTVFVLLTLLISGPPSLATMSENILVQGKILSYDSEAVKVVVNSRIYKVPRDQLLKGTTLRVGATLPVSISWKEFNGNTKAKKSKPAKS